MKDKRIFKYLIEQEDKVDSKGDKKCQHSHVVKVPGKVILQEKREREGVSISWTDFQWSAMQTLSKLS